MRHKKVTAQRQTVCGGTPPQTYKKKKANPSLFLLKKYVPSPFLGRNHDIESKEAYVHKKANPHISRGKNHKAAPEETRENVRLIMGGGRRG